MPVRGISILFKRFKKYGLLWLFKFEMLIILQCKFFFLSFSNSNFILLIYTTSGLESKKIKRKIRILWKKKNPLLWSHFSSKSSNFHLIFFILCFITYTQKQIIWCCLIIVLFITSAIIFFLSWIQIHLQVI